MNLGKGRPLMGEASRSSGGGAVGQGTMVVAAGSNPSDQSGAINPPVFRASTVVFETLASLERAAADRFDTFYYGRYGTPTTFAFEEAIACLEGGLRTIALASGHAAITSVFLALLKPGDHLLMADCVYGPVRSLCDTFLRRLEIDTTYFDPRDAASVAGLIGPRTKLVYLESPGSLTLELQDVRAIADQAHQKNCLVAMDNSWATPLLFRPLDHGVDVSILSGTKYVAGHSDCMIGTITCRDEALMPVLLEGAANLGACAAPDACYLALRGLRTLSVRLERQGRHALQLATELAGRPEILEVYHPGLPSSPDHQLFCRDFAGASGLFSIRLPGIGEARLARMVDNFKLFRLGVSWGGFETLAYPTWPARLRTARPWTHDGPLLRLSIGLEDYADLRADLFAALDRLDIH
jgi:cystathionine beta-lyase